MRVSLVSSSLLETQAIAGQLAGLCVKDCQQQGYLITLEGQLGAGKTAFSQGFIRSILPEARVKSPTFSLIERYDLSQCSIFHLDLYRLQHSEELEYLGLRDFFWHNICLIEWASKGVGWLPSSDFSIEMRGEGELRTIEIEAHTPSAEQMLVTLNHAMSRF